MNTSEFASKTIICYSHQKNERIELSCLPDDIFDKVLDGLSATRMCVEGSPFTGKYVKNSARAANYIAMLDKDIALNYYRINRLSAYINSLADGDVFRVVSEDAPTMNKQLAVLKTQGMITGRDEHEIHNDYLLRFGLLSTEYHHYAFGYDGLKTVVGEGNKNRRVCRFCKKKKPEVSFNSVAHAVSEGLGNKALICNEECDCCNGKLSKTESNLMHYLDVRRAMGGILTKSDGTVPSVDGKGFVIRGDANNKAVLYIEKEFLSQNIDVSKPFWMKLETSDTITHQGIYKALCKIVIDLIPFHELCHFDETIKWICGSVIDNELPPYIASYDREQVQQPIIDVYLSKKPGMEPYCTAVVHILDVLFLFILPEVDVDKAQFRTENSIKNHLRKFMNAFGGTWFPEDSSDYMLAYPWVHWKIDPSDPQVQIRPKSDPIFMRYKKDNNDKEEHSFPEFLPAGIQDPIISKVVYKQHFFERISIAELHQVSVNYRRLDCNLDKNASTALFSVSFNFSDSANRLSYFDFSFDAEVKLANFDKYIVIGDYFCIDYHLRDYLYSLVLLSADRTLRKYTTGTYLEAISLIKLFDRRVIRQLYYRVWVDKDRYLIVKDAELHNL